MSDVVGWSVFGVVVLVMLAVDLAVVHRNPHAVSLREAGLWSAIWITVALAFGAGIWWFQGTQAGLEYLTGYTIEKALSVDNVFVFVVLFRYLDVPARYQHRVLFWGVLGALALRGLMIAAGVVLLERFHWVMYPLGAFLVVTGLRLFRAGEITVNPEHNLALRLLRRVLPVSTSYHGERFFVRTPAVAATPLFVALVLVETTDLIFAGDSIPAIFAITSDPFVIYTSNIFAILGLRSLYFLLADAVQRFYLLRPGLAFVLVFVGVKMLIADWWVMPIFFSLGVVAAALATAVGVSLLFPRRVAPHAISEVGNL